MITLQELGGNQKLYDQILKQLKRKVSIFKRGSIKEISRTAAAECETLYIHNVELENLDFLKFFPRLSHLQLDNIEGLKNVDGICNCKLEILYCFNTNIDNFDVLAQCSSLNDFSYTNEFNRKVNPCRNLSFVKELSNLEFFQMHGIKDDIRPLLECYSLKWLDISYTPIDNVEQFAVLPKLEVLYADGCDLSGNVDLSVFPHLQMISLAENNFSSKQKEELIHKYPKIKIHFNHRVTGSRY